MRTENFKEGVYCCTIDIKAVPISRNSRLPVINKKLERYPISLIGESKMLNDKLLRRSVPNFDKYRITYSIVNKKFLSNFCYDIHKS